MYDKKKFEHHYINLYQYFQDEIPAILEGSTLYQSNPTFKEAILYSLLAKGKRIRVIILLEVANLIVLNPRKALYLSLALECIHTYSLVHDDLPCMDNDTYRRGQLTNHVVYGEATALLVGNALFSLAFEILSQLDYPRKVYYELSTLSGVSGMLGGQFLDVTELSEIIKDGSKPSRDWLIQMIYLKTSRLFRAAILLPYIANYYTYKELQLQKVWGDNLGLLFQLIDDVQDYGEGTENSNTVYILSKKDCLEHIQTLSDQLHRQAIKIFPNSVWLQGLPLYLVDSSEIIV